MLRFLSLALPLFAWFASIATAGAVQITVTTDSTVATLPTECTAWAAFQAAQTNAAQGGCPAGSATETDVIVLPPDTVFHFTQMQDPFHTAAIATLTGGGDVEVEGNNSTFFRDQNFNCALGGLGPRFAFLAVEPTTPAPISLHISDLTFSNGCHELRAGALYYNGGGQLTLDRTRFERNLSHHSSALFIGLNASAVIRDSYFADNGIYPLTDTTIGGAITSFASHLRIERSSLIFNTGTRAAAVYLEQAEDALFLNDTFDSNDGGSTVRVGFGSQSVVLLHNTFTDNTPTAGAAVIDKSNEATAISVQGNWLTNPGAAANCANVGAANDHIYGVNLTNDGTCPGFVSAPAGGAHALTIAGGLVFTRPPLPGSAAIDASPVCRNLIDDVPIATDARGVPRPQNGGGVAGSCDIGATEYVINQPPALIAPASVTMPHDTSVALGAGFSVTDADAFDDTLTLTLSASHGSLATGASPAASCTAPTSTSLQCQGRIAAVVSTLHGIQYTPFPGFGGTDALQLHVADDGADDHQSYSDDATVDLSVAGGDPMLALSAQTVAFGTQAVGVPSALRQVTISNIGGQPLTLSSIAILPQPSPFVLSTACPATLAPLESCNAQVQFTPTTPGDALAFLVVTASAANSPISVTLTGSGSNDVIFGSGFDAP